MNLDRVTSGRDIPNDFNVIIEIPMNADPIKYEVDKATGAMFVDRFMSTAMHYPCNYGYIPHTISDDGDPVDVLVLSPVPLITGVVVRCRPVGMLKMEDEAGGDAKLLAVPVDKLCSLYRHIQSPRDLPEMVLSQLSHFFEHYKDLEAGKWVKVQGWVGAEEAKKEILEDSTSEMVEKYFLKMQEILGASGEKWNRHISGIQQNHNAQPGAPAVVPQAARP